MIGKLVRYTGSQYPEMAGLEGRVHSVGSDYFGNTVYSVSWCGRFGRRNDLASRSIPHSQVKPIRAFSKGVRGE